MLLTTGGSSAADSFSGAVSRTGLGDHQVHLYRAYFCKILIAVSASGGALRLRMLVALDGAARPEFPDDNGEIVSSLP